MRSWFVAAMGVSYVLAGHAVAVRAEDEAARKFSDAQLEHFESKIRPLLAKRCYQCHSHKAKRLEGDLYLDSRQGAIDGGAIEPGEVDASRLVEVIGYGEKIKMPPKGKLSEAEIKLLRDWIAAGAPWSPQDATGAAAKKKFDLKARMSRHWVWKPIKVKPPAQPPASYKQWGQTEIDKYVLERVLAAGLTPAKQADRRTIARRLYIDLIGLPPTPEELGAFLADTSPKALEKLVDKLLASPHFGERWARHWLDLARYAESRGHEFDYDAPNAHQYRDYLIRAFNANVPYDQFLTEHFAGDLLDKPRRHPTEGFNESIIGTGFWFLGEWVHSPVDIRKDETDRHNNMLDVMSKTFMGMTVACARCHDHKFDAISQKDYYAMSGFLQSSSYRLARIDSLKHNGEIAARLAKLRGEAVEKLTASILSPRGPVLSRAADYLMAARACAAGGVAKAKEAAVEVAKKRGLDEGALRRWIDVLVRDKDRASSPVYIWAQLLADAKAGDAKHLSERLEAHRADYAGRRAEQLAVLKDFDVVIDYSMSEPHQWLQDGAAFGLGPVRPGDVQLSGDASNPLAKVHTHGAARRDMAFNGLNLAGGSQKDSGRLSWMRSGQTLRTPTFRVTTGTVYYLVRGGVHAFANVDSHYMLHGPLHGQVVTTAKRSGDNRPRWISHNLQRYRGHRIHVEFSPADGGDDVEVLMVVQGKKGPGSPIPDRPDGLLAKMLSDQKKPDLRVLAESFQQLLQQAAKRVVEGTTAADAFAGDNARVAQWLVANQSVLRTGDGKLPESVAKQAAAYLDRCKKLESQVRKTSRVAMAMWDGDGVDEYLLVRGSSSREDTIVPRRLLTALGGTGPSKPQAGGSGRLELARHLVAKDNPLTSRVIVNRLWHHLMGRGIVPSVDNFGVLGQRPSHPELLDYLADRFVREGWSIKTAIKNIVLTRTYQMSSQLSDKGSKVDPNNVLLHRRSVRRKDAEVIRDSILRVSGRLDPKLFGRSVPVHLTAFMEGRGRPRGGPLDGNGRRSIYTAIRRNFLPPMMLAFDMPSPFSSMGARTVSNVPAQALILMNDPFVVQQARLWASNLLAMKQLDTKARIDRMYVMAYARPPSAAERSAAIAFLREQGEVRGVPEDRRALDPEVWGDLCHVMFNVKEFIFVR